MSNSMTVLEKSKTFAIHIIQLSQYLQKRREYVLSKQILRSGTSIGANVTESQCAQSRNDFFAKLYIAYKEAAETDYWLDLLNAGKYLDEECYASLKKETREIICLLAAITRKSKITTSGQ